APLVVDQVFLGHPAAAAAALDFGRIDGMFLGKAAPTWRQLRSVAGRCARLAAGILVAGILVAGALVAGASCRRGSLLLALRVGRSSGFGGVLGGPGLGLGSSILRWCLTRLQDRQHF